MSREPDFRAPQGGANIPWAQTITDAFSNPIDITGATVVFRWGPKNQTTPAADENGTVIGTSPQTQAQYVLTQADLANPAGNYSVQFEITKAGETFVWPVNRPADDPYATLEIFGPLP